MQKVALLSHHSLQEELLDFLQDEGVMEVSPNEETTDIDHPEVAYKEAEILFAIDFLRPVATKETAKAMRKRVSVEEVRRSAIQTDFHEIIEDCKALEDQTTEVKSEKQQLLIEQSQLQPWTALPLRLSEKETETTITLLGTVPAANHETLTVAVSASTLHIELLHIQDAQGQAHLAAIVWKEHREQFEQIAAQHGWSAAALPSLEKMPEQELTRIKQSLRVIEGKETEIARKKQELTAHLPDLVRLAQYLHWLDEKQSVRSEFSQTEQTSMLTGWIPARQFTDLQMKLENSNSYRTKNEQTPAGRPVPRSFSEGGSSHRSEGWNKRANASPTTPVALLKIEPQPDEEPPMQIRNLDSLAPFEAVTRLYGLPQSSEMDPTRVLMPFFILYFGLCLTDAGYGLVLATLMGLAIWKFKLKRQDQKLIWLLFYAGIVTFFVSIPFGGWFGMTPDQLPSFLTYINANGDLRILGQVWDLQKDVDFFRNLALTLGAIQMLFGIFLARYWKAIHGKLFEAFTNHFAVHFFVAALAVKYLLNVPQMNYALIAIGLLFIWGQGKGPWFVRPLVGALGALGFLISLMSNILSYLRILALGLATGALAFAINQVAIVMMDLLPIFLGIPVFVAILLFGHMISIALNGLGSFVHAGRLQFIEFFGQFFQGGGREFAPFRRSSYSLS